MSTKIPTKTHGGKRSGSGRPKSEPTAVVRVPVDVADVLKAASSLVVVQVVGDSGAIVGYAVYSSIVDDLVSPSFLFNSQAQDFRSNL